ncbi:MAG: DUF3737 family protein, partial [Oscillospiraceae bacterium]|nr:DUF3737 family protein [Oscillospiraceae bacterium]
MQKRLLAIAMSLTMTFSLLPLSAFAEPVDEAEKNKMEISVEPIDDRMTEMEIGKSSTETEQNKKLNMQIFNQKDFPEQTGTTATDGDVVTTSEELANRIQTATDGATIVLGEGTFKTVHNPSPRKSLTFVGAGPKTIWEIGDLKSNTAGESNGDYSFDGCGSITFKNMTLKSDDKDYRGFIRIGNTVADNCVLEGKTAFWGYQTATFKGCTFNAPEGDYALWDYSTKNMVFDDCTFNISGKGVNVYVESGEAEPRTVTMKDCTVKSSASNKAFLNIKNNTQAYDIILIGTNSVEGLTADQTTGSVLYQVEASKITSTQKPVKVQEQAADGTLETIYEVKLPAVAKVGNTEYSTLTDAFSALSAENHVLTLIDQTAWTYQNIYWQAGDQSGSADTLRAAVQAAHAVHSAENIQIICKPETEIADSAAHIDVTRNISIYANGADFTGDDLSIGTYQAPEKEITSVNIYDAKNLVVWGQPVEGRADVWNINFVDCVNDGWNFLMYRGAEKSPAKLNLTLTNCRATGYTDSTVHTTADGSIRIKGCSFADNCAPVNIAHKQSGVMEVVIDSSTFTKCGKVSTNNYFAPVRFVNNNENGTLKAIVTKTTFIDRIGTNGDILIGDGRIGKASYDVELLVQNTEAQVQFQTPGYYNGEGEAINPDYLATAEVSKDETMDSSLSEQFAVAKVGTEFYPSLAEAIAASDSATVILLKNVTENVTIPKAKTITLDLNGCTLSGGTIAGRAALTNHGTVVIRDSGSGGEIIREDNGTSGYYTIDNQGTMTIENGKVYNRTGPMPQGSSLIRNAGNQEAILNILGGEIRHDGFIAIKNDDYGILNIAGGTITTSGDTATHTASAVQNWSKATITGGTINGTIWTGTWSDNLPASSTVIDGENVTITGQIVVRKETSGGQKPSIELKNGNFDISAWNVASGENVDVTVSGGSFTAPVAPEYLADGLNFEAKDSNGIYTYH